MAFHKIELPNKPIAQASNRGVAYGQYKLMLFGGYTGSEYLSDLNIFNLKSNSWESFTELSTSLRPSARHLHFCAYLPPAYFFIYGGVQKDQILNDTFLFNLSTYNWEKLNAFEINPGSRYGMCGGLIGNTVFIIGGFGIENSDTEKNLSDVWAFDYRSREWSVFSTIGNENVSGIEWSCVVINKQLFCTGSNLYKISVLNTQNREWRGITVTGAVPAKLERYSLGLSTNNTVFLFGGSGFKTVHNEVYSLEELDSNYIWHKIECTGNIPTARHSHSMIYLGEVFLIIGGRNLNDFYNDIYAFNPNLGLRWLSLIASGSPPEDRVGHISFYLEQQESIIFHGGDCRGIVKNDMHCFKYRVREWTKVEYKGESPALAYHTCVFDAAKSRNIIFGGGNLQECYSDLYSLSIPELEWGLLRVKKAISARAGHAAIYCPMINSVLIFGGFVPNEGYSNELWSLDLYQHKWSQPLASTLAGSMPIGRIACSFTLVDSIVYMFGGVNTEVVLDDLWKLSLENFVWERISIFEKNPGPIYGHSAILIESHIFMYTGESSGANGELIKVPTDGVLWSLNVADTPEWSRYKVEGSIPPKRFYSATLVTNDIVIYGGGPDSNVYQLDRNDVRGDAVSFDVFQDFVLPYMAIVERHEGKLTKKKKKKSKEGSEVASEITGIEEEEKFEVFGKAGKEVEKKSTKSSGSEKMEDSYYKAQFIELAKKRRK